MPIAKLEPVPLRELWKKEEPDFSTWLEQNIDALSDALGLNLSVLQRKKPAGAFQVDLVAEDEEGELVVIENQLGPTDHDHLGKLLTYLTNLEAKTAIWITSDPRPEHVKAVGWLNEATPRDIAFYLVRVAGYRIGGSDPAPLFTPIVAPSSETKDVGASRTEIAERHVLRKEFWEQLLTRAKERGVTVHAGRSPSTDISLGAGAGKAGLSFVYLVWLDKTGVELYIDTGDEERNNRIFDAFQSQKDAIEKTFGNPLAWERLEGRRACRIRFTIMEGGLLDRDRWGAISDAMISAMDRLATAFKPHIQALRD